MKLKTKIFCCVTIFFSVIFLVGGYILLSYFYETVIDREIENAAEQYQYNKFVMQATLITKGKEWFEGVANGEYDISNVVSDMGNTVAFYSEKGDELYSGFSNGEDIKKILPEIQQNKVNYQFLDIGEKKFCLVAGTVSENDSKIYLITGVDVTKIVKQQEQLLQKFSIVYMSAIAISIILIFILSNLLTRPINRLALAAKSIADGNYEERIRQSSRDEVGQLASNFNQMAEAVEEKIDKLTEYASQQEDFVANFSHELKTPLTSIIGYSNRIYGKKLSEDETKKAALYIWNEGMRLESLAHKMMDLTNLKNGDIVFEEVMADSLLRELVKDCDYLLLERQAKILLEVQAAKVRVEIDLFKTMFLNLIDNSLKAEAKNILIKGYCQETEKNNAFFYIIQIVDDGTGISDTELDRIKEAFYMVDKARSRKQHGAGLGLALAERIAKLHGSSLEFSSELGQGTTVTFKIEGRYAV